MEKRKVTMPCKGVFFHSCPSKVSKFGGLYCGVLCRISPPAYGQRWTAKGRTLCAGSAKKSISWKNICKTGQTTVQTLRAMFM